MPVCDKCGREFDTERGLHVHQAEMHEDTESSNGKTLPGLLEGCNRWKLVSAGLVVLLVASFLAFSNSPAKNVMSRQQATEKAMNYLHDEIKGGDNTTLLSTSDTNSSVYRMRIEASGTPINIFVTKDGKYLFFNSAKME